MIHYVKSDKIDRKRWDACISASSANFLYGYSWYLDIVSPLWSGLIKGDYEAVMPLPTRRKFYIHYVFQPLQCQQLGVFSPTLVTGELVNQFINALPSHIKYLNYNLNFTNQHEGIKYPLIIRTNYELPLNTGYDHIFEGYSGNTRKNLLKAGNETIIKEGITPYELVKLKKSNPDKKMPKDYYKWLQKFCEKLIGMGIAEIIGAAVNDKLCAAAFIVKYGNRIYYLNPVSNAVGKEKRAMFSVVDYLLKKYCGSDFVFDFEGSSLTGIARFFAGFGAISINYHEIVVNRLPVFLKYLKK